MHIEDTKVKTSKNTVACQWELADNYHPFLDPPLTIYCVLFESLQVGYMTHRDARRDRIQGACLFPQSCNIKGREKGRREGGRKRKKR